MTSAELQTKDTVNNFMSSASQDGQLDTLVSFVSFSSIVIYVLPTPWIEDGSRV
jgi:hypothetical protein